MKRLDQTGSHIVAVALLVAVLGVVGFAGYKVMSANKSNTDTTTATTKSSTVPSNIRNTADLTQAASVLDSSASQVNNGLDDNGLNSSLNDML